MVREVRTEPGQVGAQTETRLPSSSATTYSSVGSTAASTSQRSVRRVHMYHVGTPPHQRPEQFTLSEVDSGSEADWVTLTGHVRVVSADVHESFPCVHYNIFDAEDVSCEFELLEDDPFYRWFGQEHEPELLQVEKDREKEEIMHVRTVEQQMIVNGLCLIQELTCLFSRSGVLLASTFRHRTSNLKMLKATL